MSTTMKSLVSSMPRVGAIRIAARRGITATASARSRRTVTISATCPRSIAPASSSVSRLANAAHISPSSLQLRPDSLRKFATTAAASSDSEVVIVGGGVIGLGLACDLVASSTLRDVKAITLIEASDLSRLRTWASEKSRIGPSSQPSTSSGDGIDWENRVISLTSDNLLWLKQIGVYPYLVEHRLRSVNAMRVWDGLSGALLDFDSTDLANVPGHTSQISTMVEISNLQQAMLRYLEQGPAKEFCTIKDASKVDAVIPGSKVEVNSASAEQDPWPVVRLASGEGIQARLLVGADGPNSPVRRYAGIGSYGWPYDRRGLVATLRCLGPDKGEARVANTAFQRFLPSGTVAFLPLSDSTGSMVWTLKPTVAEALTSLHRETAGSPQEPLAKLVDAAFRLPWSCIEQLFERIITYTNLPIQNGSKRDWSWLLQEIPDELEWFERGLGSPLPSSTSGEVPPKVVSLDAKSVASFPLNLKHADSYLGASLNSSPLMPSGLLAGAMAAVGLAPEGAGQGGGLGRTALVGDAAHTIHPLAGQGMNLGIADVRSLSKTIKAAVEAGADIGSYNALKAYARDRYWENQKMLSAVDHLHWLYAATPVPLAQQADGGRAQRERDGLLKTAANEIVGRGVVWARSTGLEVINELGFVKNAFMRQAGSTTTPSSGTSPKSPPSPSTTPRPSFGGSQVRSMHTTRAELGFSSRSRLGQVRYHSSQKTGPLASDVYTQARAIDTSNPAVSSSPSLSSLTPSQRRALQDMLRVDHSGEVAANTIYQGQADMFGALGDIKNRDLSNEMWQTEKKHLDVMRALLRQHNVRPSLLLPVWAVAGRVLGGVTALLGPRSAMACTEAVESVIGEHYDDQLKELATILEKEDLSRDGLSTTDSTSTPTSMQQGDVHPSLPLLSDIIKEFRDDELEHLDTAVEHESQQAAGHALLSAVIAAGCRGAIWVASRV